jgi:LuxR family maltose regulon positive regulatory protein
MVSNSEQAARSLGPKSQFLATAVCGRAIAALLSGEVDRADDLFADAAEKGLELGATEPSGVSLAGRAAIAIDRGAWVQAHELADRALLVIRRSRLDEYPTSAYSYVVAARTALHREKTEQARELLARTQRLRPLLTYAVPHLAVQTRLQLAHAYLALADAGGAETVLREIDAILRRQPDLGVLPAQADELRSSLTTLHATAPGASTLSEAELRVVPFLVTHLTFREIGQRLFLSRHTVKSHVMAIYRKLGVTSRNAAVERARDIGLV